jgi:predicted porin
LGAAYEQMIYKFAAGAETRLSGWITSAVYQTGPHILRAYYQRAKSPSGDGEAVGGAGAPGTDGGAHEWVAGYGYQLSKRTEVYGVYVRITNGATASYDFGTNAIGGIVATTPGADPRGFALGVKHIF